MTHQSSRPPRIAIVGMAIESSSYAGHRASYRDFRVLEGQDVVARYPFLADASPLRTEATWLGVFYARSIPGGAVTREVYEDFKERMLSGLAGLRDDAPLDGVLFDIHGAMSVVGLEDAEGDLITAIRRVIGADPIIAAPMDLHGNVSTVLAAAVELLTCYRTAPHIDTWETRERAAASLVAAIASGVRPRRARVVVPILLPGEKTSTRVEPARSLYARLPGVAATEHVIDASIWIGYAWADEPRCHAAVVVTGTDDATIVREAEALAQELWRVRAEFTFVGPPGTLDEGVARAIAHLAVGGQRPYLISDSGDNPGAGGSGDVTWTLTRLLGIGALTAPGAPLTYVASIFDAAGIEELARHHPGEAVDVTVGAVVDSRVSGPVRVRGTLVSWHDADPDAGRIAVVANGGLRIVITEFRKDFHATSDFADIGLDPAAADIIVTKIGYLEPTLYDIAGGWTLALTPGPVDQDLERLGHHRIQRPMFPFDEFATAPALRAELY